MHTVYILFSKSLNRFYTGFTSGDLQERLDKHNTNHKGYTGKANDWSVMYFKVYLAKNDAQKRERQIKKWKSRKLIGSLIKCHEK